MAGPDAGANDYVTKPFAFEELVAENPGPAGEARPGAATELRPVTSNWICCAGGSSAAMSKCCSRPVNSTCSPT